jgi:pimeloyl-ACP methyl ester carboxylesterase
MEGMRHRLVQTFRLRVHIAEAGEGESVLLLHGWPQHWYAWRKVISLLAANHRLISPDLRAFVEAAGFARFAGESGVANLGSG